MTDEDLRKALAAYADRLVSGPVLKGLPRGGGHEGDVKLEELEVARLVLKKLGHTVCDLESEPHGTGTLPDVAATLIDGSCIGIEITELVDGGIRRLHIKRRDAERDLGLSQIEATQLEMAGRNPTPDHISRFATAIWTPETLLSELERILTVKDLKCGQHKDRGVDLSRYAEMILAVFTGEHVTKDVLNVAMRGFGLHPRHFSRVVIVLDYDPGIGGYPVLPL